MDRFPDALREFGTVGRSLGEILHELVSSGRARAPREIEVEEARNDLLGALSFQFPEHPGWVERVRGLRVFDRAIGGGRRLARGGTEGMCEPTGHEGFREVASFQQG